MIIFAKNMLDRRIPQYLGVYIGISWGVIQFTKFIVDEFLLSPQWTRIILALTILLIPSVIMIIYNHGRPGPDQWLKAEKICIPTNLVLAVVALFLIFRGADLGAVTTTVTVKNEDGKTIQRAVPKLQYRKRTAMFAFDPQGLSEEDKQWLPYLVPYAVLMDLAPDDFFETIASANIDELVRKGGFDQLYNVPLAYKRDVAKQMHADHLYSGKVSRTDKGYRIRTKLYEVVNGDRVADKEYEGSDLLALVDQMSSDLKSNMGIPDRDSVEDLPVSERLTNNTDALKAFGMGLHAMSVEVDWPKAISYLQSATSLDPTYTDAQRTLGTLLIISNKNQEALAPTQAALDHIYRLPERYQFVAKSDYFFARQDMNHAWAVLEMWAELYPNDTDALKNLGMIQIVKNKQTDAIKTFERLYSLNPADGDVLKQIAQLNVGLGNFDKARTALETYVDNFPEDYTGLTALSNFYRDRADYEKARHYLDRAVLMEPGKQDLILSSATLDAYRGKFDKAHAGFEQAIQAAGTPQERLAAYTALQQFYSRLGQIKAAIEISQKRYAEAAAVVPPVLITLWKFDNVGMYFEIGRKQQAVFLFASLKQQLQPPFDVYALLGDVQTALELKDADRAEAALDKAEAGVKQTQMERLKSNLAQLRGDLAKLREQWQPALEAYRSVRQINPANYMINVKIGTCLRQLGQLDAAETAVRESLRYLPFLPPAYVELSHIKEARGDKKGAITALNKALDIWKDADPEFKPANKIRTRLAALEGTGQG